MNIKILDKYLVRLKMIVQAYVKLQNPKTLYDIMVLADCYNIIIFVKLKFSAPQMQTDGPTLMVLNAVMMYNEKEKLYKAGCCFKYKKLRHINMYCLIRLGKGRLQ